MTLNGVDSLGLLKALCSSALTFWTWVLMPKQGDAQTEALRIRVCIVQRGTWKVFGSPEDFLQS